MAGTPTSQTRYWEEPSSPKTSCLTRLYAYTSGLEPCQVVYAHDVAYGEYLFLFTWDPGPWRVSLTSRGTRDWVTRVNHGVPCASMTNPPKKTLDPRFRELYVCAYHTLWLGELRTVHATSLGKDNWSSCLVFLHSSLHAFFPSDDSNLYLFFVIKHNHNSFSEFCEFFQTP